MSKQLDLTAHAPSLDILSWHSVYLVGIKGVGVASLAVMLQEAGLEVSGADVEESFVTDAQLESAGISVEPFTSATVPEHVDGVIFSGAHQGSNHPLVQQAVSLGKPCLSLAEAVGALSTKKKTIVTCGVGGKSTTAAWLSTVFQLASLNASYSVGVGSIPNLGASGHWSTGEWFVVEGDEYVSDPSLEVVTPRFLYLQPHSILCTGIAFDHPDVYGSEEDTLQAFTTLWEKVPADGVIVVAGDDRGVQQVLQRAKLRCRVIRVGTSPHNDVHMSTSPTTKGSSLTLIQKQGQNENTQTAEIVLPGAHNALNASLVATLAQALNVPWQDIQRGLLEFRSTPRRFEFRGTTPAGVRCFDDYAHHPRELAAIAQALKTWFADETVTVAFQPHTYSRTKSLFSDFVSALEAMPGKVLVLPIFASAREAADSTVSSQQIVEALQANGKSTQLLASPQNLLEYVQGLSQSGVFITLGAGDIYTVYDQLDFSPAEPKIS